MISYLIFSKVFTVDRYTISHEEHLDAKSTTSYVPTASRAYISDVSEGTYYIINHDTTIPDAPALSIW